ncbi:MAG: hypothetical protein K2N60_04705 [Oscillospiraceae bacterium]|nr:hypothetical protein [Oscillospiraceae bacterium]
MNITSMSNRELYKTLTGYDYPNGAKSTDSAKNMKFVELNEPFDIGKNTVDPTRLSNVDPEIMQKIKLQKGDTSILKSRDSFEYSGGNFFKKTEADKAKTSADRPRYSNDIDFNDSYVKMVIYSRSFNDLSSGIVGGVPTKERIAEHYGKMAKRLDAAYAEGKFTKEEYDYLNKGIAERMEHSAACAEETAAGRSAGYDRTMSQKASEKYLAMSKEERREYMQSQISDYIDKYYKIDRTSLMKLFNSVRYGK